MSQKLTHPDSKDTIEVNDAMVDTYVSQGWQRADNSKPTTKKG